LRVERFVSPAEFDRYQQLAESFGFLYVAAGPLVRSSYRAAEFFMKGLMDRQRTAQPAHG
jgi:lipoic acid synthetase